MLGKLMVAAICALAAATAPARAQSVAKPVVTIRADQPGATISRDIFGQFAEMLGEGIIGGAHCIEGRFNQHLRRAR